MKTFGNIILSAAIATTFTLATIANAATHYVYNGQSIQTAINNAVAGDEIIVADGTYGHISTANKGPYRVYVAERVHGC
jgi:hypothetical protein